MDERPSFRCLATDPEAKATAELRHSVLEFGDNGQVVSIGKKVSGGQQLWAGLLVHDATRAKRGSPTCVPR